MDYHRHSEEERRKWQSPEEILSAIGLGEGMTFADIGCGRGFFAVPAARMVGPKGTVYALDADADAIRILSERARDEGLANVKASAGRAEESAPCEGCADVAFFGQCLHDFDDPGKAIANAGKCLKPAGVLVDLDWKKEMMKKGPPYDIRFSVERAQGLIEAAGFRVDKVAGAGSHHYLITARREDKQP